MMEDTLLKNAQYSLPFTIRSRMKWYMHLLYFFMVVIFAAFLFIPIDGIQGILLRILWGACTLFIFILWFYTGILRKTTLKISEEKICLKTLFSKRIILWRDVADIETFEIQSNAGIGVVTKEKQKKLEKGGLSQFFTGRFSLSVMFNIFPDADREKLYSTMDSLSKKALENTPENEEGDASADEEKPERGNVRAFFRALLVSLAFSAVYGISLYFLQKNYLVIPFLGLILILYVYNAKKSEGNLFSRLLVGLLCAFQVMAGLFIDLMIYMGGYLSTFGFWGNVSICFKMMTRVSDYLICYLLAACLFLIGALSGISFKFTRKIKKHFLKQKNGYFIEKDRRYVSVYLTDYAAYDEKVEKYIIRLSPNTCLIEKQGRKLLAFYLPSDLLVNSRIYPGNLIKTRYNNQDYYKIDLGGCGEPKPYGYDCVLVCNQDKQPEFIKLDID